MITLDEPRAAERSGSAAPLAASGRPSSPSIVLLDNYDSFTFNLYHRLGEQGAAVRVLRTDAATPDEVNGARLRRGRDLVRVPAIPIVPGFRWR